MIYAEVIGDPIAHSKSPAIHGFWLGKLGIAGEYRRCHVRGEELAAYFAQRRGDPAWRGCNITIPHKQAAIPLVDEVRADARAIGAINTVLAEASLVGWNTDVAGIREALARVAPAAPQHDAGRVVHVIGAGGAARAAGAAFRGAATTFFNRDPAKARRLAEEFSAGAQHGVGLDALPGGAGGETPLPPGSYVLVNASSMGMNGRNEVPIDLDWYPEDTIVFDMVYAPLETGLLRAARARGLRTIDGLAMLIGQAAAAFALFFGQPAPRQHDAELRALLTA